MKSCASLGVLLAVFAAGLLVMSCAYTVGEGEQVVITQFGKPVGESVLKAGLHFKLPFIQVVNRFEKRVLEWDGPPSNMTTKDKANIVVDTFGRWRISDPLMFLQRLRDERSALSRLDDIIASETPNVIARHDFIEVVRTTKDRVVTRDESMVTDARVGVLTPISQGRTRLEAEVLKNAAPKVKGLGIELLDVRFKRINYNEGVSENIYTRMISERVKMANLFRSEGEGDAAKRLGEKERELARIESEAYKKVQEIEGAADAKATEIYAKAYNQSPEAAELFEFQRSMEAYKTAITQDTTLILTTDSELLKYMKSASPESAVKPMDMQGTLKGLPSLLEVR
jgi:membrane protease subunit HflC